VRSFTLKLNLYPVTRLRREDARAKCVAMEQCHDAASANVVTIFPYSNASANAGIQTNEGSVTLSYDIANEQTQLLF
jgi:hypothetical protein